MSIVLFASIVTLVNCTNCNAIGSIEVPCDRCNGSGLVDPPRSTKLTRGSLDRMFNGKLPCPSCTRGLRRNDSKGSGVKKVTCKVCRGYKKVRAKKSDK